MLVAATLILTDLTHPWLRVVSRQSMYMLSFGEYEVGNIWGFYLCVEKPQEQECTTREKAFKIEFSVLIQDFWTEK